MLPRHKPETMAEVTRMPVLLPSGTLHCHPGPCHRDPSCRLLSRLRMGWIPGTRPGMTTVLLRQREYLTLHEAREDVVLLGERILVLGRERLLVGLDQAVVAVDGVEGLADLR